MIGLFTEILKESVVITTMVILLMMLIEFIHVHTRGKGIAAMDRKAHRQILLCALLGLTPGCAGVFAAVSLYTHNIVGFGALLAACIASFGDEAFYMLSIMPAQAALTGGILFAVSLAVGYGYQLFHPFQSTGEIHQMDHLVLHEHDNNPGKVSVENGKSPLHRIILTGYIALFAAGIATGLLGEGHEEGASLSGENVIFLIIAGCALMLCIFCSSHFISEHLWNHIIKKHLIKIFIWTFGVLALLGLLSATNLLEGMAAKNGGKLLLLLLALLIGLIPQSGPHLAVICLFADGIIPFSTLLANCLLQEGHGGIPLMAESPKAFVRLKCVKLVMAAAIGLAGLATGW